MMRENLRLTSIRILNAGEHRMPMSTGRGQRWRDDEDDRHAHPKGVNGESPIDFSGSESILVDEPTVSSDEIEIVVAHIKRLGRNASLEFALRVGAVIIHYFYGGDTEAWRRRGPKTVSFRRLAQHPELPLSPGSLYRSVALFELCERLRAPSRWEHLGASHLRLVLGLPESIQEKLLAAANTQRWSVKALKEHVTLEKSGRPNRGGRRTQPAILRSLMSARRCLADSQVLMGRVPVLTKDDVSQSLALVDDARSCLDGLIAALRAASTPASDGCPVESGCDEDRPRRPLRSTSSGDGASGACDTTVEAARGMRRSKAGTDG